ncbi:UNVERIFIED_CONTAM: hypothetical protein RMT77_017501 [Armadillidium vulgare]|nr:Glutathione S-transferase 1-1 [Armadillidium vulgare]
MDLYYFEYSAPCRAVMLTAKALGLSLNKKRLHLFKREHINPEFLAINPQHCVPTLVDGDLKIWESRAICTYLASKYGKDDSLYPNDPSKRVLVDRLLYFDMGVMYKRFRDYFAPAVFKGEAPDLAALESTHEGLKWFNDYYLDGHDFCVGNNLTVADFALVASVTSMIEVGIDMSKYPNITAWVERCKAKMPGYETENGEGVKAYGEFVKSKFVGK